jgi:5'-deoxynucleotidase YfbR-like HD superfamily hydrolase
MDNKKLSTTCSLCKQNFPPEDMQDMALLPANLIHHYEEWFGKPLEVQVDSEQSKAIVCYNCFVRYSGTQHTTQLDILSNSWDKYAIKDDLLSLALIHGRKLSYLMRFAGAIRLHEESVAEHSYWVTLISYAISQKYFKDIPINTQNLFITAMFHDWSEIITSDVITPLKVQIKKLYDQIEDNIVASLEKKIGIDNLSSLMSDFNNLTSVEGAIVAIADKISCYLYIREEALLGNQNFRKGVLAKVENDLFDMVGKIKLPSDQVAIFEQAIEEIIKTIED